MKSSLKKVTIFLSVAMILVTFSMVLAGCTGKYDATKKEGDLEKATSLTVGADGKFKILQLADLHLTSNGKIKHDKQTLKWVEEAIDKVKPNLVEVTGDAVGGGVSGRDKGILALANIFEEKQVYWAYTFGNHDGEHTEENGKDVWSGKERNQTPVSELCAGADIDAGVGQLLLGDNFTGNEQIFNLLKGYKYCLLARSEEEMAVAKGNSMEEKLMRTALGVGNYVIDLVDSEGNVVFALFHMDTHGKTYINPKDNDINKCSNYIDVGYIGLTDAQIRWYEEKVANYSEQGIASAIFMHVPNYRYRELTEVYKGDSKLGIPQFAEKADIKYWAEKNFIPDSLKNIDFVKEEGIYAPRWNEGLMNVIKDNPSTTLISVGHDHNNSFMLNDNGVILGYGRTSGVNAWGRDIEIGASVFTIDTKATGISQYKIDIVQPSFKYIKKGTR